MNCEKYRDASKRLTLAIEDVPTTIYHQWTIKIVKKFKLFETGEMIYGLDEKFQPFSSTKGEKISIEWDNWSGFSIVALDIHSEKLLVEIEPYLTLLNQRFVTIATLKAHLKEIKSYFSKKR